MNRLAILSVLMYDMHPSVASPPNESILWKTQTKVSYLFFQLYLFFVKKCQFSQLHWIEKSKISNSRHLLRKGQELLILDFSIHVNCEKWQNLMKKDTIGKNSKFNISLDGRTGYFKKAPKINF